VVPTAVRLNANPDYTGKGVTIAFLDSGFYPHADLREPADRLLPSRFSSRAASAQPARLDRVMAMARHPNFRGRRRQWGALRWRLLRAGRRCRARAGESKVRRAESPEDNIARGIEWVIENRERFNIRVLNISLGGDERR